VTENFSAEKKFNEPFFHNTVFSLGHDERLCVQTSFDVLEEFENALAPRPLLFSIYPAAARRC